MKKKRIIVLFLCFFMLLISLVELSFAIENQENCHERRVIFDFGSGSIKSEGIIYNTCTEKIDVFLGKHTVANRFSKCLIDSQDNTLSKQCIDSAIEKIVGLEKQFSVDCKKEKCIGIATAWARSANNVHDLINIMAEKNIHVDILSQETEGYYGFYAAIQSYLNTQKQYANYDINDLAKKFVVFDIGAGSFQLSFLDEDGKVHVYEGDYGVENYEHALRNKLNYTAKQQYPYFDLKLLKKALNMATEDLGILVQGDRKLKKAIHNPTNLTSVIAIGSVFNIVLKNELQLSSVLTKGEIRNTAKKFSNQTIINLKKNVFPKLKDNFITTAQSSLIAIYGVMNGAGINKLHIIDANITDYIISNPKFW